MKTVDDINSNEGAVIEENGAQVAVYKNEKGEVTKLSPVCTHQACLIEWNGNDKVWDCPCHGSRFKPNGKVINGPAVKDLQKISS